MQARCLRGLEKLPCSSIPSQELPERWDHWCDLAAPHAVNNTMSERLSHLWGRKKGSAKNKQTKKRTPCHSNPLQTCCHRGSVPFCWCDLNDPPSLPGCLGDLHYLWWGVKLIVVERSTLESNELFNYCCTNKSLFPEFPWGAGI